MHAPRALAWLVCVLMLLCNTATAHDDDAYSHSAKDRFSDKRRWMKDIRDDVMLSELAIPGTHDSATFNKHVFPIADDVIVTQTLDFDQQLEYGIRVLDLRVRRTGSSLALHHGPVYLDKMFGSALESIARFLKENPSEAVLFRLREEHTPDPDVHISLEQVFKNYMQRYEAFYLPAPRRDITLGEVRGKFVLLSNIGNLNPYGLSYASFDIQDDYALSTNWSLHDKYIKVMHQLYRAAAGNPHTFYVNYLSGSGGAFPYFVASGHVSPGTDAPRLSTGLVSVGDIAWYTSFPRTTCVMRICTISFEGTNVLTRDDLKKLNEAGTAKRTVGIIMADFPGESLIANVIANNHHVAHDLGVPR